LLGKFRKDGRRLPRLRQLYIKMKSEFSKTWNASRQPRKQRKFLANAPNHIKHKLMGSALDRPLRQKYGRRSIEVVKGDEVKIMRGKFKGKQGKVGIVDVKHTRIQVDGVQRSKGKGGEKLETWFHPSKVKVIVLNDKDSKRLSQKVTKTEVKKVENKTEVKPKETKK
jgi:large subunit ribosomal protein L24